MEVSLVKTTSTETRKTKGIVWGETFVHIDDTAEELGRYSSIDEAIQYALAHMIRDIANLQRTTKYYGFQIIDKYDIDSAKESNNLDWVNGFTYQYKSADICGFRWTDVRYAIVVLKW
jgi:hypothetical protein